MPLDVTYAFGLGKNDYPLPWPAVHGVVRWRLVDLCQWMWDEHRVSIGKSTMSQEVRRLARAGSAIEDCKKVSSPDWRLSRKRTALTSIT